MFSCIALNTQLDKDFISLSLVAALSVFFLIIVILVVAFCIRFKKKVSDSMKLETPIIPDGDYDLLLYATSDNYDLIGDAFIDADLKVSSEPHQGPQPAPRYSGLTPNDATSPAAYYCRMNSYVTSEDISFASMDMKVSANLDICVEKQVDASKVKKRVEDGNESAVRPYIEFVDDVVADIPHACSNTSDFDVATP